MLLMSAKRESHEERRHAERATERQDEPNALLALLRLLTREPQPGHDFKTCAICKRYGITQI